MLICLSGRGEACGQVFWRPLMYGRVFVFVKDDETKRVTRVPCEKMDPGEHLPPL